MIGGGDCFTNYFNKPVSNIIELTFEYLEIPEPGISNPNNMGGFLCLSGNLGYNLWAIGSDCTYSTLVPNGCISSINKWTKFTISINLLGTYAT